MLKTCPICQKEKNIKEDFYQTKSKKNGQSFCKSCFSTYCMERWKRRKLENEAKQKTGRGVQTASAVSRLFLFALSSLWPPLHPFFTDPAL